MNEIRTPQTPLIELDLLKTLVAIAETGNFSAAGDRVGRTPSAISMQVKRLEELVDQRLFERDARSVQLTKAGETLLIHARSLLAQNRQIMAQFVKPEMAGEVRLGMFDDVAERFLPEVLRKFYDCWPGVGVKITVENSAELAAKISAEKLDVAIVSSVGGKYRGVKVEELLREDIVWAGLKCGVSGRERPLPITVWDDCCTFQNAATSALEKADIEYNKTIVSASTTAQKSAVAADFAVAPLAKSSLDHRVVDVGEELGLPYIGSYTLGMAVADVPITAPIQTMLDHLRLCFSGH